MAVLRCDNCQSELRAETRFCTKCGSPAQIQPTGDRTVLIRNLLLIVIVVFLLVIMVQSETGVSPI